MILSLKQGVIRDPVRRFKAPIDFSLCPGEQIALIGSNGSGKSTLIETLLGSLYLQAGELHYQFGQEDNRASIHIRHITFRDAYGSADRDYYYQQRWNHTEHEGIPTVGQLLAELPGEETLRTELYNLLEIAPLLEKEIILLSSGELRRFQLVKMLLTAPRILILENPFIGLDAPTRTLLVSVLKRLTRLSGLQLLLVVSAPQDIPDFITHVYTIEAQHCGAKETLEEFRRNETFSTRRSALREAYQKEAPILPIPTAAPLECEVVVQLRNISIHYGNRILFNGLNWTIRKGEKWVLTGRNGSGKSTLLSLINADNPQAYAQDITLFGRKRGTGESIWEIKKKIGYLSPEMHRAYLKHAPTVEIVASGLFDTIGLYTHANEAQLEHCTAWLRVLGLEALRDCSFMKLSSGEQRLVLLTRAFVKDPDLLILDEPLHGLDGLNKERARAIIEAFAQRPGKTLIYVTHYEEEIPRCVTQRKVLG